MSRKKSGSDPDFLNRALSLVFVLTFATAAVAQECRVLDVELQEAYAGPCVEGLAEGEGYARGTAEYRGGFKAGMKHGRGVKVWPNGDRYEGEFVGDRKEGRGKYTWGRGPWMGESYEGEFVVDRRHGHGVYRYSSGDVYDGPWENDIAIGAPTPMMQALAKHHEEARAAVANMGQKVCRAVPVGIGERDWVRGTVEQVAGERVGVRIDDPGEQLHVVAGAEAREGAMVWDFAWGWTPCY